MAAGLALRLAAASTAPGLRMPGSWAILASTALKPGCFIAEGRTGPFQGLAIGLPWHFRERGLTNRLQGIAGGHQAGDGFFLLLRRQHRGDSLLRIRGAGNLGRLSRRRRHAALGHGGNVGLGRGTETARGRGLLLFA